jgi:molybdopterin converting factor subunit 1
MMKVRLKLFAMARDIVGAQDLELTLPASSTTGDAIRVLLDQYPALKKWELHLRLAVNYEYAPLTVPLHENDEVAVIPPVSGG